MCIKDFNPDNLLECMKKFIIKEKRWVSDKAGFSLYIRPFALSMTVYYYFIFNWIN